MEVGEILNTAAPFTWSFLPNLKKKKKKCKKAASEARNSDVFRCQDNAKRWFPLHSQQKDLMAKPRLVRAGAQQPKLQKSSDVPVSEIQLKASKLKCFDRNVYFRVSCNPKKEMVEHKKEEKGTNTEYCFFGK